jgi:hypothetical protein
MGMHVMYDIPSQAGSLRKAVLDSLIHELRNR